MILTVLYAGCESPDSSIEIDYSYIVVVHQSSQHWSRFISLCYV